MRRADLNFIVDALAFVAFLFLTVTGVLVRWVLPPGSGHGTTLWGLGRHGWGDIHFWVAVALFAALALHVFLHWRWIVAVVKGRPRTASGPRLGLAVVALVALVGLSVSPFLGEIERTGSRGGLGDEHGPAGEGIRVDGSMTLEQIAAGSGVPVPRILEAIGLPPDTPPESKLGHLKREHGLDVHAVRGIVLELAGQAGDGPI